MKIVFDIPKLREILLDYYQITGVRIGIRDTSFNEVGGYPPSISSFCKIIRNDPAINNLCKSCDNMAYEKVNISNNLYLYTCHAGLVEAIAPIKNHNILIGYVMIGQMLYDDNLESRWLTTLDYCKRFNIDTSCLKQVFFELPTFSPDKIKAMVKIMQALAAYIWLDKLVSIDRESLSIQIENYIHSHLAEPISISCICNALGIGKTTLCHTVKNNFKCTLVELVRLKRIEEAKQLLKTTDSSISDIGSQIGISDYNYFSRVFKQAVGLSPTKYRKS